MFLLMSVASQAMLLCLPIRTQVVVECTRSFVNLNFEWCDVCAMCVCVTGGPLMPGAAYELYMEC